jgi:hypothetical protein
MISRMTLVLAALMSQCGDAPMSIPDDACPTDPANALQGQGQRDPNSRGAKERARAKTVPVELKDKPVTCRLVPVPEKTGAEAPPLPEIARQLQPGRKLVLVVGDQRTNVQPGVTYRLYLDLPQDVAPEGREPFLVGPLNFFNATTADDPLKAPKSERFVSFDVTAVTKTLSAQGKLKSKSTVTFIPDATPAEGSRPIIGEIKLIER